MQKPFYLKIIILSIILLSSLSFASGITDSLEILLAHSQGIEKLEAKLELSYHLRRSDTRRAQILAQETLDEIDLNYKNEKKLKTRALYCLALSYYYDHDYKPGLDLLYRLVTITQDSGDDYMLADIYFFIGATHYFYYGDNQQAINYYNQCIHYGLISDNYRILGAVYSALSSIFRISGSYEKSLEFIYNSRENYAKSNYVEGIAWVDFTMGSLYSTVGLYEEAKIAFNRSLSIYRKLAARDDNMTGVAICLNQLCVINTETNHLELAKKYNQEALEYYIQENSDYGISNSLKYQANIEKKLKNYSRAIALLDSSLTIKKRISDKMGFSSIYSSFGELFIEQEQYERALDSLFLGLKYARMNNQTKNCIEIDKHIASAYEKLGIYDKAFEYKSMEVMVADSIFNYKTNRNMLQLETLYDIENKEKEISRLENEKIIDELNLSKQQNMLYMLFVIIGLALIIISAFVYYYREKSKANRELKERQKLVEEMNATKDKFFSILAHDLRNPFNSILGLTNILREQHHNMNVEERDKIINTVYKSSNHNFELLNNLLEWSRTQRGAIKLSPETFQIADLANEVKDLLYSSAQHKGISIEIDEDPMMVTADKNMINTVMRNLVSNAIKYSNNNDSIRIHFTKKGKTSKVSITDTGIGINNLDLKRLFKIDENYRADGTAGEKGTGLGLIICKEFVEQHHGEIWAESEPGIGSTFHFTLEDIY